MVRRALFSHESINTVIALVGLAIACATAWTQFQPPSDSVVVTSEGRVALGNLVQAQNFPVAVYPSGKETIIVGPVFWKVQIYNERDRPVSLVKFITTLLPTGGPVASYSSLEHSVLLAGSTPTELVTPLNIGPREARAIYVGLNIPVEADATTQGDSCVKSNVSIRQIEECFYKKGRDLFGNKVEATFFPPPDENPYEKAEKQSFLVSWEGPWVKPSFLFTVQTADGTEFPTTISY